ncbi:MAG: ComEC/Rec2 family competence protein [Alphaproteobacteria bacterium]|nr:ComEC/Rec2 family competence protein [Alphaproteobacteria bacterium]
MRASAYLDGLTQWASYGLHRFGLAFSPAFSHANSHANAGQFFLFLPVYFGIGLIIYFALPSEPPTIPALLITGLALAVMLRFETNGIRQVAIILFMIAAGFSWAQLRTQASDAPMLSRVLPEAKISGFVRWSEPRSNGSLLIIEPTYIRGLFADDRPHRVRLYGKRLFSQTLLPGCVFSGTARLTPLGGPDWPSGYDPRFTAHFKKEGARGFLREIDNVTCPDELTMASRLARFRLALAARFAESMSVNEGGIAVALITGIRGRIKPADRELLRASGLAHMLAISGMHMALIAGTIYGVMRLFCALFPVFAQRYSIRPFCAGIALIGAVGYLFVSGASVATQRAFIMITLVFVAIMLGRAALTMRNVALAALIVLILAPHSIMLASFQMSFAAVIALVAFYQTYTRARLLPWPKMGPQKRRQKRIGLAELWGRRVILYFLTLLITSLIAGGVTGFVGAYHFNYVAIYGLAANLLAIPILGLVIMPAALCAMLLMPFGAEAPLLAFMEEGIRQVLASAAYVTDSPRAVLYLPASPPVSLPLFSFALVWLCLHKDRIRLLGFIPLIVSCFLLGKSAAPDVLVHGIGYHIAARQADGKLAVMSRRADNYVPKNWLLRDGDRRAIKQAQTICREDICVLSLANNKLIVRVRERAQVKQFCDKAEIIITTARLRPSDYRDCEAAVFDRRNWRADYVTELTFNRKTQSWTSRKLGRERGGRHRAKQSKSVRLWMR